MNDPRDFFLQMREKLTRRPDRAFDQEHWAKFEKEFAVSPAAPWTWFLRLAIPAGAALVLSLFVFYRDGSLSPRGHRPTTDTQAMQELVENAQALADKDMALFLVDKKKNGNVKPAELLELSDEDWKFLLHEEHG